MNKREILLLTCSHFNPNEDELRRLSNSYPDVNFTIMDEQAYTEDQLGSAEIIVGFPHPGDLKKASNLKWLQTPSAGIAQYVDTSLYVHQDILLSSGAGTYGRQIADHVVGMIIGFNHNFYHYHDQMKTQQWERYFPESDIWDSTLVIIGFGDIGNNLAKRAHALGMHVIAIKRTPFEKPSYVDELYTTESIDQVLSRGDYVVMCAASTAETDNLLHKDRIGLLKKGSYFINVARGGLVDQQALTEALERGQIAGAALDVTDPEPLPKGHKLWTMPNVFITPHASGLSKSDPHQVFEIFFENLGHYLNGQHLRNQIDFARKY